MQAGKNIHASELQDYSNEAPFPCYGGNGIRGYLAKYSHHGTFPIIGRQGALCGNIKVASGFFYATEHAVVVEYFAGTNVDLWMFFLEYLNLNQYATATAQPGLSVAKIEEVPIPLPPLNEQCRIVEKIFEWLYIIEVISHNVNVLKCRIGAAKSKILELAMRGKLVPQNPADEPAADILRRINPKAKIITDNPHSWNIPKSWALVRIKDVFNPMERSLPKGENFKYIDIDSIDNEKNRAFPKEMPSKNAPSRASRKTRKGDVLFSMVRPYLRNIAIVPEDDCIASTGFFVLNVTEAIDKSFAFQMSISPYFVNGLNAFMKGDNSPSINKSNVENFIIGLPPLDEQKRIVTIIEELYVILDEIEASLQA